MIPRGSHEVEALALLRGARVALVGFPAETAGRLEEPLRRAGARTTRLEWSEVSPPGEALEAHDLAIVDGSEPGRIERWWTEREEAGFRRPTLLAGPAEKLLVLADRVDAPLLLEPWTPAGVSLRASLTLGCAEAGRRARERSGSDHVVVADDDETITSLVSASLRSRGYRCHLARDGLAALELARRVRPAAVILDVQMPGRDGFDVLSALADDPRTRSIPVVLLTARRQEADVLRGFELGAADYVVKPFNPRELVARLERVARKP